MSLILVIGGSASGKSAYAEARTAALPLPRVYLATMEAGDTESRERISRHRVARQGLSFRTVECPRNLEEEELCPEETVLLECLSNLTANEMFPPGQEMRGQDETAERVTAEVLKLKERCRNLIVVGNVLTEGGRDCGESTDRYLRAFSEAQNRIAAEADEVIELRSGIPLRIRRAEPADREGGTAETGNGGTP